MPKINSASFNVIEIRRILSLLEELLDDDDYCEDCVREQLMMVEALAEEAVAMDPKSKWLKKCKQLSKKAREWEVQFNDGVDIPLLSKAIGRERDKLK